MNQQSYLTNMKLVAYLCARAVRGEKPDPSRLANADADLLLKHAEAHMVTSCVATALESAGLANDRTREAIGRGVWRAAQLEADWARVQNEFEQAGIWYCPLKGMLIKELYPAYGMRQMTDYDVLFDESRSGEVRAIMERLGFSTETFGQRQHDTYHKLPVTNFELHRSLFGKHHGRLLFSAFEHIKDHLVKDEGNGYGYHMSDEDCYLYLLAHEYKHFSGGGTGIRSLLDTYLYLNRYANEMDWNYIAAAVDDMGIASFEQLNRKLSQHLFDDEPLTPEEEDVFTYIAASGTLGTVAHTVENSIKSHGGGLKGKLAHLRERMFPSTETLAGLYPSYGRHPVLFYPAITLWRLGKALTVNRARTIGEMKLLLGRTRVRRDAK